jgi:hypothetical protein
MKLGLKLYCSVLNSDNRATRQAQLVDYIKGAMQAINSPL